MTNLNLFAIKDSAQSVKLYVLTNKKSYEIIKEITAYEESECRNIFEWFKETVNDVIITKTLLDGMEIDKNLYTN